MQPRFRVRDEASKRNLKEFCHQKMAHIAVERKRRRQMNENLGVLRSLTPCFYIKRGDQASVIGGVIEFIKELHLVLQSLESTKRRKSLSPSPSPSPRQLKLTPPPLTTPPDSPFGRENVKELSACCNSQVADVEAKISGSNVILRTISKRIPGQIAKIIILLEKLGFEILHTSISSMEDTVLYSFVIKVEMSCLLFLYCCYPCLSSIFGRSVVRSTFRGLDGHQAPHLASIGLECQLSVEDLTVEVQQSFCKDVICMN